MPEPETQTDIIKVCFSNLAIYTCNIKDDILWWDPTLKNIDIKQILTTYNRMLWVWGLRPFVNISSISII